MAKTRNMEELYKVYESKMQEYITTEDVLNIGDEIISKTDEINNLLSDKQQALLQDILELEYVDNIIVIDNGKVIGTGSHQQLLKENKDYKKIIAKF